MNMSEAVRVLIRRARHVLGRGAAEHVTPKTGDPLWGEHRSRYTFAVAQLDRQGPVLDVACGSGYGLTIMRAVGGFDVVGADIAWGALAEAAAHSDPPPLVQADALRLPVRARSFRSIVSFETLEHIPDARQFVAELARVVEDGGVVVLSTPNAAVTKPVDGVPRNPFHVEEFTLDELADCLQEFFGVVEILGQTVRPPIDVCPLFPPAGWHPTDLRSRLRVALWWTLHRLRLPFRQQLWQRSLDRPFYPGEDDFSFSRSTAGVAHVHVAICRHPIRRDLTGPRASG